MYPILSLLFIALTLAFLAVMVTATWISLPGGNINSLPVTLAGNATKGLRSGKAIGKVFFWGLPVFVFLFTNWAAGAILLTYSIIAATAFVPRYNAALARAASQP